MNQDFVREFVVIDNGRDAWDFTQRYLAHLRNDPELGRYPAEEIFLSELRWCFGEGNRTEDMPFNRIQMWAKVAVRLIARLSQARTHAHRMPAQS